MTLPFTSDAFLQVFADYNRTFWPAIALSWLASAGLLLIVQRQTAKSGWMTAFLSALWLWNGLAYHALFFSRINPAAWLFAGLFVIQAAAFVIVGRRHRLEYFEAGGTRYAIGVALTIYALAYPALTVMLTNAYPAVPLFAVPCPTDILTVGLLLTVRGRVPLSLAIIPALWALIGGSAAIILSVPTDFVLLASALLLPTILVVERSGKSDARLQADADAPRTY